MAGQWAGSTRRQHLPPDWPHLRQQVLRRDSYQCTWTTEQVRCPEPATDVDHIRGRTNHQLTNLRALCSWHHKKKTAIEGNTARTRRSTKRTPEQHPGLK